MAPFWKSAEEKEKKEKVVESGSGNRYGAGIASFLFHVAAYELLGKTLFPKLLKWSKVNNLSCLTHKNKTSNGTQDRGRDKERERTRERQIFT